MFSDISYPAFGAGEAQAIGGAYPLAFWDFERGRASLPITFARAGTASAFGASGTIENFAANVPRSVWSSGRRSALFEGASTNLLPWSVASSTNWSNNAVSLVNLTGNYLGAFPGVRVASTGGTYNRLNAPCDLIAGSYYVTMWFKLGTSGKARCSLRSPTGEQSNVIFDGVASTVDHSAAPVGTIDDIRMISFGDQVWQLTFRLIANVSVNTLGLGPYSEVVGQDVIALGAQVEGNGPTSYVATAGAAVTRQADVGQSDVGNLPLSGGFWILISRFRLQALAGSYDCIVGLDNLDYQNRNVVLFGADNGRLSFEQKVLGTSTASAARAHTLGSVSTVAVRFAPNNFAVVHTDLTSQVSSDCGFVMPTRLYFAARSAGSVSKPARMLLGAVSIYPPSISVAQMTSYLAGLAA